MKKVIRLTENDLIRLVKKVIKEEVSLSQNSAKVPDLLHLLNMNLWEQFGQGGFQKSQSKPSDAAKNIKINDKLYNGRVHHGLFLYRKKRKFPVPGVGKDSPYQYCEILLTKDMGKVNVYNVGGFKQFNLDNETSFNELKNLISSKEFTQY